MSVGPNDVVTRAIDAVCVGGPPDRRPRRCGARARSWRAGRARSQTAAFLIALRAKGETVAELVGLARTMRVARRAGRDRPRTTSSTPPGTGGGPSTFNVSTTAALVAAGAGCARRQARQPLQHQPVRLRRPARGARRQHRARPRAVGAAASTRSASASCSRRAPPRAMTHVVPGAQGAGGADDLQLPRPADQPGRRRAAAARRLRPPLPGDDRRGAGRAGCERAMVVAAEDGLDEIIDRRRAPA